MSPFSQHIVLDTQRRQQLCEYKMISWKPSAVENVSFSCSLICQQPSTLFRMISSLDRLSTDSGISGSALSWISSYLTNRTQSVLVFGKYSDPAHLRYGVPQGSELGPALFSDYSSPVASLIHSFNIISAVCAVHPWYRRGRSAE